MSGSDVVLVSMPWYTVRSPSIQLGILQSMLDRHEIQSECKSYNLDFLAFPLAFPDFHNAIADYGMIADDYCGFGIGDWIFSVPPFREFDFSRDQAYAGYLRRYGMPESLIATAFRIRASVPAFLEQCLRDIRRSAPRVVAFSTMFSQSAGSLCLAKMLKAADPSLRIVFGGANTEAEMGTALFRGHPFVDAVVRGEGEVVFPSLVEDWLAGRAVRELPGLCIRDGDRECVTEHTPGAFVAMDDAPLPDYSEFFQRLERHPLREQIEPQVQIPYESARGCWWGAKSHCTFCGLNGTTMAFRSKTPQRVFEDIMALARKHRKPDFFAVDNILDLRYFKELLPKLRDTGFDMTFFYEVKANIKKQHLRLMSQAGLRAIQPGIETFSTPILKLMRKGTTGLQNVRLLKWCAQFGIDVQWNLLYGFPNEPPGEYDKLADVMLSLTHLKPPRLGRLKMDRFSPYYNTPEDFGLEITGPLAWYQIVYDLEASALNDIAYSFEFRYLDGRDPDSYIGRCREVIDAWNEMWPGSFGTLLYKQGPGFLVLRDRRPNLPSADRTFDELETRIYLACADGATAESVHKRLQREWGRTKVSPERIQGILEEFAACRFVYEEEGHFLSLALRANLNETTLEHDPEANRAEDLELSANAASTNAQTWERLPPRGTQAEPVQIGGYRG